VQLGQAVRWAGGGVVRGWDRLEGWLMVTGDFLNAWSLGSWAVLLWIILLVGSVSAVISTRWRHSWAVAHCNSVYGNK
jgi:hypothetical protein